MELPVANQPEQPDTDGMVFIAYGEKGDDVAFEICTDIEEALGVYQIMREDGFSSKLYQAQEILIQEE